MLKPQNLPYVSSNRIAWRRMRQRLFVKNYFTKRQGPEQICLENNKKAVTGWFDCIFQRVVARVASPFELIKQKVTSQEQACKTNQSDPLLEDTQCRENIAAPL